MESRNYTITLEIKGLADSSSPVAGATTSPSSAVADTAVSTGAGAPSGGKSTKGLTQLAQLTTAYHTVKSFALQQINYDVSMVELRTGSRDMQERANFYNSVVQKGLGIAEATAVGFAMGNLPGALAGLMVSTTHTAIGYAQKQNTINLQQTLENRSLEMMRIRAGALGSRSNVQ